MHFHGGGVYQRGSCAHFPTHTLPVNTAILVANSFVRFIPAISSKTDLVVITV